MPIFSVLGKGKIKDMPAVLCVATAGVSCAFFFI
jgi:hypothetical protein